MANQLNQVLKNLVQRTSTNTGKLRSEDERAAFSNNVRDDFASVLNQLNTVYYPLMATLMSEQTLNALDYGLSGNVIKTHVTADLASASAYWNNSLARARTIKETIDVLLAEITRLEGLVNEVEASTFDDSALQSDIDDLTLDLQQLAKDTMGPVYQLDGDGVANLSNSLAQALDAIGAFFVGFPGTGNTYTTTYPTLSLSILLSNITLDTTIPPTIVAGLVPNIAAIRTFIGMDSALDSTPDFSAHGAITYISDGDSLELTAWKLDAALAAVALLLPAFTAKAVLYGDGTTSPDYGTALSFDEATGFFGVGTDTPEQVGDFRGIIQHSGGVISRGGNARGVDASDLQVSRLDPGQVASGARASILGGANNRASGTESVAGGTSNTASNTSAVALGSTTTASGAQAFTTGYNTLASGQSSKASGDRTTAAANWSSAEGSRAFATRQGEKAYANGRFAADGDCQFTENILRNELTGVGPAELFLDGVAATLRILFADNTSYGITAQIMSRDNTGNTNHYIIEGTFKRGVGAGTVVQVGALTTRVIAEDQAGADATLVADPATGGLNVVVTGIANVTLRWIAHVKMVSIIYA